MHFNTSLTLESAAGSPTRNGSAPAQLEWLLSILHKEYGVPAAWAKGRIDSIPIGHGMAGAALLTEAKEPFLLVIAAKAGHMGEAESRLRLELQSRGSLGLGICTDGSEAATCLLRKKHSTGEIEFARELERFVDPSLTITAAYCKDRGGKAAGRATEGRSLLPLSANLESLFFDVHSHMRDIDGLHADEALDELTKLLQIKIADERNTHSGSKYRLQAATYSCAEEFAFVARTMYLSLQSERRSNGEDAIRLSTPALAKALSSLEQYDISASPADVKGRAFQRVLGPAARSGMGQYFTPSEVVGFMVDVIDPQRGDVVIDPFCGSAHFLECSLEHSRSRGQPSSKRPSSPNTESAKAVGLEKSERMARIAQMDAALRDEQCIDIRCVDSLLDFRNYRDLRPDIADVAVTNPPFGSLLGPESLKTLGAFELAASGGSVPLEVLGLERSIQFLRPGGRLGIVLPEGVLSNAKTSYVRQWLYSKLKLRAIVALPSETFAPFGANVRTCILFGRKWRPGEKRDEDYEVLMVKSDCVGYDASGRPAVSDLPEVRACLRDFIAREGW